MPHSKSITLLLAVVGLVGLFLDIIPFLVDTPLWLETIFVSLGTAAITAAILGLTIDRFLKKDLAKDAVEAALGYLLPPDLKDEMRWVYDQHFLAEEHVQSYDLSINPDGETVTMHVEIIRRIINFTDVTQELTLGLAIDEWGFHGRESKIIKLAYFMNNEWHTISPASLVRTPDALKTENIPLRITSKDAIEIHQIFEETRRINDESHIVFGYPTKNPRVIVNADEALDFHVGFSHRKQPHAVPSPDGSGYRLPGTLLPLQKIRIRWWKREKMGGKVQTSGKA